MRVGRCRGGGGARRRPVQRAHVPHREGQLRGVEADALVLALQLETLAANLGDAEPREQQTQRSGGFWFGAPGGAVENAAGDDLPDEVAENVALMMSTPGWNIPKRGGKQRAKATA